MIINARDPRQWTYLRNLPQKKKNPSINQCGEKGGGGVLHIRQKRAVGAGGGDYIPAGLKISEPSILGKK
jgi:hypothetical protein